MNHIKKPVDCYSPFGTGFMAATFLSQNENETPPQCLIIFPWIKLLRLQRKNQKKKKKRSMTLVTDSIFENSL